MVYAHGPCAMKTVAHICLTMSARTGACPQEFWKTDLSSHRPNEMFNRNHKSLNDVCWHNYTFPEIVRAAHADPMQVLVDGSCHGPTLREHDLA